MTNWNELRDRAYKTACEHGFHDEDLGNEHYLCLVISELMEAVQADRKGKMADMEAYNKYDGCIDFIENFERHVKDTVEDELADVCIRLLDLAGLRNIDIKIDNYCCPISKENTFTKNVYYIAKYLTLTYFEGSYLSLKDNINFAFSQVFALAEILGIDLLWHIEAKMKYNETREYKHGRKY